MTCDNNQTPAAVPDGVSEDASATGPRPATTRAVTSEDLFQGQREVLIVHAGETYRLRLTRNGKLILNK